MVERRGCVASGGTAEAVSVGPAVAVATGRVHCRASALPCECECETDRAGRAVQWSLEDGASANGVGRVGSSNGQVYAGTPFVRCK